MARGRQRAESGKGPTSAGPAALNEAPSDIDLGIALSVYSQNPDGSFVRILDKASLSAGVRRRGEKRAKPH